jgi:cytoskeleton-associated protein 5
LVVYQGPVAAPKRAVRAVDAGAPSGGTDGLPREDISGKLTASLMKNMSSADWKVISWSYILTLIIDSF